MTDAKRRIERKQLADRIDIINDHIKTHLSQAQRADTHTDAVMHYADIQQLAKTAREIVIQIEAIDIVPVQEKML